MKSIFYTMITILWISSCSKREQSHRIEKVVILVIDGVRYSDLHEDSLSFFNQEFQLLKEEGLFFSNFFNSGLTFTQNGMSNIVTGFSESMKNNGSEVSDYLNIFQYYLESSKERKEKAWIIASKDKLESLGSTNNSNYKNRYSPMTNCGINGLGSGYRNDSVTQEIALHVLKTYAPKLIFVAYREPDYSGHQNNWENYKLGIKNSLKYTREIVDYIKYSKEYSENTLILITNDHGRHLNNIADGFTGHGDDCDGCRHITLLAISPSILKGITDSSIYSLHSLAPTVANAMNFVISNSTYSPIPSIH